MKNVKRFITAKHKMARVLGSLLLVGVAVSGAYAATKSLSLSGTASNFAPSCPSGTQFKQALEIDGTSGYSPANDNCYVSSAGNNVVDSYCNAYPDADNNNIGQWYPYRGHTIQDDNCIHERDLCDENTGDPICPGCSPSGRTVNCPPTGTQQCYRKLTQ